MRGARGALALVVALQLVAETALTPYWPQLLRALFGVEELAATGTYLTVCRIAGLAALPLWGLAARRWPLPRLLVAGLLGSAVFDLGLALAPSLTLFTALSAGVVATGSSLVLAYPALVAVVDRRNGPRLPAVVTYAAVFHAAAVLATVVGAAIVALPQPRLGLAAFALADLVLAVVVQRAFRAEGSGAPPVAAVSPTGPSAVPPARPRLPVAPLAAVAGLAVLVDLGTSVARPFFTELVLRGGGSLALAAVLFLLPAVAALAVLPAAPYAARRCGVLLLPVTALLAAGGLALQAVSVSLGAATLPALAAGRVVLGLGLGLVAVALDLRLFAAVGTAGPGFTAVETGRAAALLAAPLLAAATASVALPLPLVAAAVLFVAAAVLAGLAPTPMPPPVPPAPPAGPAPAPATPQEVPRDLDPVH